MKILVINCGSSSAKYELFDIPNEVFLRRKTSGSRRTSIEVSSFGTRKFKPIAGGIVERIKDSSGYAKAIGIIKKRLLGIRINGIGHRVVHGGEEFKESTIITKKVIKDIEKFNRLAPLHNPPSLAGIKACFKIFPSIPQAAVFDTAFHQTMPDYSFIYGIPYEFYKKYGIRRYGFHGTSHRYVAGRAARKLRRPLKKLSIITVHLGNGCSMTAVNKGRPVDTTMGFTPLEGLLMGTRSGDLDPAIITFLMRAKKWGSSQIDNLLNKKSGLLGVSGISNDMRDILDSLKKGNRRAKLAFSIFVYRIKKYIGAFAAAMGGLDAVVFTAGIGENVPRIKNIVKKELKNVFRKKIKILTVPTNEELLIAQDTYKLIKPKCT